MIYTQCCVLRAAQSHILNPPQIKSIVTSPKQLAFTSPVVAAPTYPTRSPPPHVQGQSKGCKWIGLVKEGKLSLSDMFPTLQMFTKRCSGPDIQSLWVFCHLIFVGNNHDVVHRNKMTKTLGVSMRPASHSIISLSHSIIILSSSP